MARNREPPAYWKVVEPVWDAINIYDGPAVFLRQFGKAPPKAGLLFAAHWCQSEVFNGGFEQFFANPTGVLAPEALEAYRTIGLKEWADVLAEAMQFFGDPYPRDQKPRERKLKPPRGTERKQWRPFAAHDERFYQWSKENPQEYVRLADLYARNEAG